MDIMVKSWQNAAEVAVSEIYDMAIPSGTASTGTLIRFMRFRFDAALAAVDNYNYVTEKSLVNDGQVLWSFVGRHALNILTITGWRPDKQDMIATLIRKQKDYGPENIARFGNIGLLIRMHDKIARLENIYAKCDGEFNAAVNVNAVSDETIIDTLIDIVGYSAIALMWSTIDEEGNRAFLYEMSGDV